jgi:hypothetical protein
VARCKIAQTRNDFLDEIQTKILQMRLDIEIELNPRTECKLSAPFYVHEYMLHLNEQTMMDYIVFAQSRNSICKTNSKSIVNVTSKPSLNTTAKVPAILSPWRILDSQHSHP